MPATIAYPQVVYARPVAIDLDGDEGACGPPSSFGDWLGRQVGATLVGLGVVLLAAGAILFLAVAFVACMFLEAPIAGPVPPGAGGLYRAPHMRGRRW